MITEVVKSFKDKIVQSQSIIIVPHHNPDGDAMGSALGLNNTLQKLGKQSAVVVPSESPSFLNWMIGADGVINFDAEPDKAKLLVSNCDLLIMVDFNCTKRVKGMQEILEACKSFKIIVDHHPYPDMSAADIVISDITVSSTCELMFEVLTAMDMSDSISVEAARCFYAGIMTDTGSLSHNSSRSKTYHVVADLLDIGIDKDGIHQLIFHSNSVDRMRLLGYCLLEKMILLKELRSAYISLTEEELIRFNFKPGDTEGLVNYPLGIEGIEVSALFIQKDNRIKISLRSQGDIAVNALSEENFNGGGHLNAAGGESKFNMDDTIQKYIAALPAFVK